MRKLTHALYNNRWLCSHTVISLLIALLLFCFFKTCSIDYTNLLAIVNKDTVSLLASISGFVFTAMTVLISLDGNRKIELIKSIGKQHIIYNILLASIISFVSALLLMVIDINALNIDLEKISKSLCNVKEAIEWISLYLSELGFVLFFSCLRLIYLVFKD